MPQRELSVQLTLDNLLNEEVQELLMQLSGKWKLLILWRLSKQRYWFNQLKRDLGDISTSSLTRQLTQLEAAGFIERKVYPVTPPVVEYNLTSLGKSLSHVVKALDKWANDVLD